MVVGTVYCDSCSLQHFSKPSYFISGASVSVECNKSMLVKSAKTNKYGVFKFHLPFKLVKSCSIKLIKSSDPHCSIPSFSSLASSSFHLKSKTNGLHVFSAGLFPFCSQTHHSISEQMASEQQQQQAAYFFPPPTNPSLPTTPPLPIVGGGGRLPYTPNPILAPPPSPIVGGGVRLPYTPNPVLTPPPSPIVGGGGRLPLPPNPILTPPSPVVVGGRTPPLQTNPARTPPSPALAFSFPPFTFPFPYPFPQFPGAPPAPRTKDATP